MKRLIIGTAGHIDHGKTTLVKALTGRDTDRLKEEKQRGISIELGFAPFELPGGQHAAIVDVPGHERFIRHMLAGAFGIDMVLFTIAADEGVMPQTREHMDIIELLGVKKGIVVITKKDMVDEEWLLLMEEEIREYLAKGPLAEAPILSVSAVTGEGIPALLAEIERVAETVAEKSSFGYARLPIDRVFSISGFGTVVTGTLWSGEINVGDTLELMPVQKTVKIRTLQVHNEKVPTALAGQRVAVNLQGIELAEIKRGYLLASPGYLTPSHRVDARLRLLSDSPRTLRNFNRVRFHLGTDESLGRVFLLDRDELLPGEEGYVQIAMEKPIVAYKGDLFVLRYYSPVHTIGGGAIIDPTAPKQKRFREDVLEAMAIKEEGSLYDLLLRELQNSDFMPLSPEALAKATGSEAGAIAEALAQLVEDELIADITGRGDQYISRRGLQGILARIRTAIEAQQEKYPLRFAFPREELRSRYYSALNAKAFNHILRFMEEERQIVSRDTMVALPDGAPVVTAQTQARLDDIVRRLDNGDNRFAPPSSEELAAALALPEPELAELLNYLFEQGLIVKVAEKVWFSSAAVQEAKALLEKHFATEKELSMGAARDLLGSSRKYVLPLIEYLDRIRFTRRVGDVRMRYQ
ncbi:MAG: selenocysteine-specific translation elongation factor [Syntrophomonadaceae bacterium]|nr:selenocysteine-specific translation elongation factor [Syntrophomonadaceae bacterium]